jgi:hypothetical protein
VPRSTLYVQVFYPAPPFVTVATHRKDMGPVERWDGEESPSHVNRRRSSLY